MELSKDQRLSLWSEMPAKETYYPGSRTRAMLFRPVASVNMYTLAVTASCRNSRWWRRYNAPLENGR